MIVRPYEAKDREPLKAVAHRAGVRFTDPEYRLHRLAVVAEEKGIPTACLVARQTAEVILMFDPEAGTPLRRLHTLKSAWPFFAEAAFEFGIDDFLVPLDAPLQVMTNGLVFSRQGFKRDTREHLTFDLVDHFEKERGCRRAL